MQIPLIFVSMIGALNKAQKADIGNIAAMLISFAVAIFLPFKLFLFSYAVFRTASLFNGTWLA